MIECNIFKRARTEPASSAMTWIKTSIANVCVFLVDFAIEASVYEYANVDSLLKIIALASLVHGWLGD